MSFPLLSSPLLKSFYEDRRETREGGFLPFLSHPSALEVSPARLSFFLCSTKTCLQSLHPSFSSDRSRAMDLGDGLQEELLGNSPSLSSDSSWTSFDCSTDLTSVSSDLASTPVTAPSCCKLFDASIPKSKSSSSSAKGSSGGRIRKVAWRETSFLGDDE